jgi:protein O-mannosyl-transferase
MNHGFHNYTSRWWRYGLSVSLICIAAAVIYSNTFQAPFVFDDQHAIQENIKIRNLNNFYSIGVFQTQRPLTDYSFAVNYHFGKFHVFGYHLVNFIIHILNGVLVFFLSLRIFRKLCSAESNRLFLMALFSALLFTVHPLQTQAVTYISQRYTSMAALFYLLAVLSYMIARNSGLNRQFAVQYIFFALSLISGLLAFFCKQNAGSLPLVILLLEYGCYDRTWAGWKQKIKWVLPGMVLFGLVYACNLGLFSHSIQFGSILEDVFESARETREISRWQYLCTQFNVISIYIRLLFIPVYQNLDYMFPIKRNFFDGATPYAFVFLVGIVAIALRHRKKHPLVFIGVLWFFITLSIESSIFPIRDALFEHRLYLPMFGFSIIAAGFMDKLMSKSHLWSYGVMLAILAALSVSTYQRNEVWRDKLALWSDVVQKKPSNYRGLTNLGLAIKEKGDLNAALSCYDRAIQLKPDYYIALSNKGALLGQVGKNEASIPVLFEALRYKPNHEVTLNNLGVAFARKGNIDEAVAYFQKALASRPQYTEAHFNLATTFANTGKLEPAVAQYLEVLRLDPDNPQVHYKVGVILHMLSRYDAAVHHFGEALRLGPKTADIYLNMGNSQLSLNALNDATASYTEAVRLNPKSVEAYTNLGVAQFRNDNKEEAVRNFNEALKINPESVEAHANLANVLYAQGKMVEALQQFGIALRLKPDSREILNNINMIMRAQSVRSEDAGKK